MRLSLKKKYITKNRKRTGIQFFLFIHVILLCCSSINSLYAQPSQKAVFLPVVRIDPYSRVAQQTAPFDHHFYLMLPVDSSVQKDELKQLDIFKIKGKGSSAKQIPIKSYRAEQLKTVQFVDTPKESGYKYLKVYIDTQFLANTRFSVVLTLTASHEYFQPLNDINQELYEHDAASAENDYNEIQSGLSVKYSKYKALWPPFRIYQKFVYDSLLKVYNDIAKEDSLVIKNLFILRKILRATSFQVNELFQCNCEKDFVATELFNDSTKFLIPLQNILSLDSNAIPAFAQGRQNIQEFEPYKLLRENDLMARVNYLRLLKTSLYNISYFFHLSSFSGRLSAAEKVSIHNVVQDLQRQIDFRIKLFTNSNKKIRDQINGMPNIFSAELAYGGTSPMGEDLQTASGHYIIADFGLVNAFPYVNNKYGYLVRPYLGVNFSFLALDKSQPMDHIENKRFWHHWSGVVGLTTTALSQQNIYDLIKNMSVVTGLAYRISRGLRITGGAFIYKKDNNNPVLAPVVAVAPMVALSLDLDITKLFGDLKSLL